MLQRPQRPKRRRCNTLTDSVRRIISMISIDLDQIFTWEHCHWLAYEIIHPPIGRSSKTDSICVLGVRFTIGCS